MYYIHIIFVYKLFLDNNNAEVLFIIIKPKQAVKIASWCLSKTLKVML